MQGACGGSDQQRGDGGLEEVAMQEKEFDKLMDLGKHEMPKMARLDHVLKGLSYEEKVAEIKKNEQEMPKELHAEIQQFVRDELKKGKTKRQIRKLVKKKYKIIIV